MKMNPIDFPTLCRDLLFVNNQSALRFFSKTIPEEDGYKVVDALALEQAELIRQAENLHEYARVLQVEGLGELTSKSRKSIRQLGHVIKHYTNTINQHNN